MPKVIAVDLDGTLLRSDGALSARTIAALRLATTAGARIVVVTARPPRFTRLLCDEAEFAGPLVCSNGAIVYHPESDRIEVVGPLDPRLAERTALELLAELPQMSFAVETGRVAWIGPGYGHRATRETAQVRVSSLDDLWAAPEGIVKLLAWSTAPVTDRMLAQVTGLLPEVTVTHSGGSGMIEISAAGVSKVRTLSGLCAAWETGREDVIAFGDMPNDLPVLRWAGTSVAMANAHPRVRDAATRVTLSNDADGVAVVIEEIFATLGDVIPAG